MNHPALENLKSDQFVMEFGLIGNPVALHSALKSSAYVKEILTALSTGEIDDETIRGFVSVSLRDLKPGELFAYDLTLAAIAVAVESRATALADEYLLILAALKRPELPLAIRVARIALRAQSKVPGYRSATCSLVPPQDFPPQWQLLPRFGELDVKDDKQSIQFGAV